MTIFFAAEQPLAGIGSLTLGVVALTPDVAEPGARGHQRVATQSQQAVNLARAIKAFCTVTYGR